MLDIQSFDFAVLDYLAAHLRCGFLDVLMPAITFLGNGGWLWIAAGFLLLIFRRTRPVGLTLLLSLALGALIGNVCLKNIVARARPCWLRPDMLTGISAPSGYSFPSGHSLSSAAGATVLTHAYPRAGFVFIPLALLIAFSRMYLYVHFFTDVLVGLLIGLVVGYCMSRFARPPISRLLERIPPRSSRRST